MRLAPSVFSLESSVIGQNRDQYAMVYLAGDGRRLVFRCTTAPPTPFLGPVKCAKDFYGGGLDAIDYNVWRVRKD